MNKIIYILAACCCSFIATAQKPISCFLEEKDVQREKNAILLTTACPLLKTADGANLYNFLVQTRVLADNSDKQTTKLLSINAAFYTGVIRSIKTVFDSTMLVYQYKNGVLERADTVESVFSNKSRWTEETAPVDVKPEQVDSIKKRLIAAPRPTNDEPMKKPVLYLYPTQKTDIEVSVLFKTGRMTHPYPAYEQGWHVSATPDGTITNKKTGKQHYCLFWESEGSKLTSDFKTGFVIEGSKTAKFLEEKLPILGLSPKEANEFIIFWLPMMENNAYNAIYFAQSEYQNEVNLNITPKPDALIRVMMLWKSCDKSFNLPIQELPKTPVRKGFTAVEWGGMQR